MRRLSWLGGVLVMLGGAMAQTDLSALVAALGTPGGALIAIGTGLAMVGRSIAERPSN